MNFRRITFVLVTAVTALQTSIAAHHFRLVANARAVQDKPGPFAIVVTTNGDFANPIAQLGLLDLGRGMFRSLANLATPPVGIGKGRDGQLYAVDYKNNLVTVNPLTGEMTVVGPTGLSAPGPSGAAADVFTSLSDGELFLMDFNNVLYSVDKDTGAASLIGPTSIPHITTPFYGTSFSGDCGALYFTVEEGDENGNELIPATLYRINPHTASATRVGPTASFMGGSVFVGNELYGFKIDENLVGGTTGPQVLDINLATGAAAKISTLNVPSIYGGVSFGEETHGCRAR